MKALKIAVDFQTGRRAGGINPKRNKALPGDQSWQNIGQGVEIRACPDHVAEKYRGVEGIEVLEDEAAIDAAAAELRRDDAVSYSIDHEHIVAEACRQDGINVRKLARGKSGRDLAKALYDQGVPGVSKREPAAPLRAADMAKRMGLSEG